MAPQRGPARRSELHGDRDRAFADRERIFMKSLERDDWDLFLAVVERPTASRT